MFQKICYVSIPHRYAKNRRYHHLLACSGPVSIPHRYAKNPAHP